MKLTKHQTAVLAHVVIDPEAWQAHNEVVSKDSATAEARLAAKVARCEPEYRGQKDRAGYMTRSDRGD